MEKRDEEVKTEELTKEDLILVELRNIKENQDKFENSIKEGQVKFEESLNKRFDKIERNDLVHIEKELTKLREDNISIKKSLEYINKLILLILGILVTIVLGAAINYLFFHM